MYRFTIASRVKCGVAADLDTPDFQTYPLLRSHVPSRDGGAGDLLYMPPRWWHEVHGIVFGNPQRVAI
jgi:hypothetical protein